jgi:hypothetical protein
VKSLRHRLCSSTGSGDARADSDLFASGGFDMNTLLNKLLLSHKFLVLAVLASILVAIPTVLFLAESNKAIDTAAREAQGTGPARRVLDIVHLVQQRRALVAMQLATGEDSRPELHALQHTTDRAIAATTAQLAQLGDRNLDTHWQAVAAEWALLTTRGAQVGPVTRANLREHTALIARMLKTNEQVLDHFALRLDPEPDSYFLINSMLVRAPVLRETLGQIRGYGSDILAIGKASADDRILVASRSDRAGDYYNTIDDELSLAMANSEVLRAGELASLAQESRATGARVIGLVADQLVRPDSLQMAPQEFFQQVSDAIDAQLHMSNTALNQLDAILAARVDALTSTKHKLIGAILLLSILAIVLGQQIIGSVTGPLGIALQGARLMCKGAAEKIAVVEAIADGKLDGDLMLSEVPRIKLGEVSNDEVGELLSSIVRMGEMQRSLDSAFAKMTISLRENRATLQARDWLKSGLNELGDLMRDEHATADMGDQVLAYLARRVDAQVGALYRYADEQHELVLLASYALTRRKGLGERCALGHGLVGQAAYERKVICLADVPPDYLAISSGLGIAVPRNVMAVPLLLSDTLVGVLELGTFQRFSELQLEFLERARDSIAVGLHMNLARQRMQELLAVTQRQAREWEAIRRRAPHHP